MKSVIQKPCLVPFFLSFVNFEVRVSVRVTVSYSSLPLLLKFASLTQVCLFYSSLPFLLKFASLIQVCLSYSSLPLLLKFASLTQVCLSYSSLPHLLKFASLTQVCLSYSSLPLLLKPISLSLAGAYSCVLKHVYPSQQSTLIKCVSISLLCFKILQLIVVTKSKMAALPFICDGFFLCSSNNSQQMLATNYINAICRHCCLLGSIVTLEFRWLMSKFPYFFRSVTFM